jgi:hypothetical protein
MSITVDYFYGSSLNIFSKQNLAKSSRSPQFSDILSMSLDDLGPEPGKSFEFYLSLSFSIFSV